MRKQLFLGSVVFLLVCFFARDAHAGSPIIRSGETVTVNTEQVLEGDFYGMGENITLSGTAEYDVYAAGGTITLNAPVTEDLTAVGGTVSIHGTVGDDVRVVAGDVTIAEPIADDLVVFGGKVTVLSTASVGGDIIFYGGDLTVDGPVEGTLYGKGDTVRVNASVGGDITMKARTSLTLGDRTVVAGNVTYESLGELVRAQNATIMGTITREEMTVTEESPRYRLLIIDLIIFTFSGLSLFFLLRARTDTLVESLFRGYGRYGLLGLGMLFALPLVAIIFLISGIGVIVGLSVLFSFLALLLASFMLIPIVMGKLVQKVARLGSATTVVTVLIGACVMLGILFVPVLGFLIIFVTFLVCFGLLCLETYNFFRRA